MIEVHQWNFVLSFKQLNRIDKATEGKCNSACTMAPMRHQCPLSLITTLHFLQQLPLYTFSLMQPSFDVAVPLAIQPSLQLRLQISTRKWYSNKTQL